jgi:hypothetical protein
MRCVHVLKRWLVKALNSDIGWRGKAFKRHNRYNGTTIQRSQRAQQDNRKTSEEKEIWRATQTLMSSFMMARALVSSSG